MAEDRGAHAAQAPRIVDADDLGLGRDELAALLAINRAIGRHLDRDELFGAMATSLQSVVATQRFGIELPIEGNRLQGHLLTPRHGTQSPTKPTVLPAPGTVCDWVLQHQQWLVAGSRDELRERFPVTFDVMQAESMESLCALPLVTGPSCRGVLFFMAADRDAYRRLHRPFLEQIASIVAVAVDDCLVHEEVRRLRDRLAAENVYLQEEIREGHNVGRIIGESGGLRAMTSLIAQVAPTGATVLVLGETGTGKELVARAIHERSPRRDRALVKVNCAAISAGLVESELFGHVRGAFTGALSNREGRFALADGGTIFLDEIGELPPETQARLLRVLQEREFEPVGSSRSRSVDVRVIAATNRDLERAVAAGQFRSDLFYRLNVVPIRVPPLRERREDVPALAYYFVEHAARAMGKAVRGISPSAMARLMAYEWPGNVRELQNVLERATVLATGPVLDAEIELAKAPGEQSSAGRSASRPTALAHVQKQYVQDVLDRCGWRVDGPDGAAHVLGLKPSTLRSRMKKLGIRRPAGSSDEAGTVR